MTETDRSRLFRLRCRSKRGEALYPEDQAFIEKMWRKYPKEYGEMDTEVFEETKPFGAL